MKTKRASKSGLFLIELIIAILFFAVASVVCVQLFVKAHLISRESQDKSAAMTLAQDCAEEFKAMDADAKERLRNYDGAQVYYFGYRDGELAELAEGDSDPQYTLTVRYGAADALYSAQIFVARADSEEGAEPLFALEVKDYAGGPVESAPVV